MKPWLFDILACPMDKHYPLKLYIFSYETKPEEFKLILSNYEKRTIELIKKEDIIKISHEDGLIYLKDNVIIEKKPIESYLQLIISSINELNYIFDRTNNEISKKCFNILLTDVKNKILVFSRDFSEPQFENIYPELYLINKIKIDIEIDSGLLFCEKCLRWFPIISTIPQMLPDEYRDKDKDLSFLKTNKNLLEDEFFNQDLKPYGI